MENKKLSLLETLQLCRDMWRWLEKNPSCIDKTLALTTLWDNKYKPYLECFCCEYVIQKFHGKRGKITKLCGLCPLTELWVGKEKPINAVGSCICESYVSSPWYLWNYTGESIKKGKQTRKLAAKKIADFCENKIKEMLSEKN